MKKADLIEMVTIYQTNQSLLTKALETAVSIAERGLAQAVAVSKRLLKVLDGLFNRSLASKPKNLMTKKKAQKKLPIQGKSKPSERYKNLETRDVEVTATEPVRCQCGHYMSDSGMRETSERLEVIPKRYFIARHNRVVYTCKCCHGGIQTAPVVPQIIQNSCYGDSFVKDVVLSKACDLIPITRYVAMAARDGIKGIPANSLHEFARHLAIFLSPSLKLLIAELQANKVLNADETLHKMLEQGEKKSWYLWSFNATEGIYFVIRPSRAGAVASEFLDDCRCTHLVTDAYKGYSAAIKKVNEARAKSGKDPLIAAYCNAHARNRFMLKSIKDQKPAKYMIWIYKIVFLLYRQYLVAEGNELGKITAQLQRAYALMKAICDSEMPQLSTASFLFEAFDYFSKYYDELTVFLQHRDVPMHNMRSENSLRNPVVGRKIWYGTHSVDSANAWAKIFSIVETCKYLGINPRAFVDDAVNRVHLGKQAISPYQYKLQTNSS